MGGENNWRATGKACSSCKTAAASVFCHVDSFFLCLRCDSTLHVAANKGGHARVWVCEVCEQAPAMVTCKADAASLCATCDRDIHSANPLARRHDRVPVVPFYDSPPLPSAAEEEEEGSAATRYLSDSEEVASWLLPNPNPKDELKPSEYLFSDVDPYLDLDLMMGDQKPPHHQHLYATSAAAATTAVADGVVPVVAAKISDDNNIGMMCIAPSMVEGVPCYDDMDYARSKPFLIYNFNSQSITQSVSSSSLEVGVVPDNNNLADVSTTTSLPQGSMCHDIVPLSRIDREARVMRYREKRKNRKFEKTIRYASRKAYAETRPRIKGRFAKRINGEYDVVPSF